MELVDLDTRMIFAILNGKVSAAINRKLSQNFHTAEIDLTPEQWTILLYLTQQEGVTQQQLCTATFKDKPSMTRLIDAMEEKNLVIRIPNRFDRRMNLIYLTHAGREMKDRTQAVALRTLKESLRGLGLEEMRMSQEVLRRIFENTTAVPYEPDFKPKTKK